MTDECERCGQRRDIRTIKMRSGGRKDLCFGCFVGAKTAGRVDRSDPRISQREAETYNTDTEGSRR